MSRINVGILPGHHKLWRLIGVCAVVLAALLPSLSNAAKPDDFVAGGQISYISDGTVQPAGESGRWVVVQREIAGSLAGGLNGAFVLSYKANVELPSQAGEFHGTLQLLDSDVALNVNGSIQPLGWTGEPFASAPILNMSGHWNSVEGGQGHGTFEAWAIFVPDAYGHVIWIPYSAFVLNGQ